MARLPHLPTATRFYARVLACQFECPRCGHLIQIGRQGRNRGLDQAQSSQTAGGDWDATTARVKCRVCRLTLLLGLLAWPVRAGGWTSVTKPMDQVPNERQLAELRGEAGGFWMPEEMAQPRFKPEHTNITAKCCCAQDDRGELTISPACLIHGSLL